MISSAVPDIDCLRTGIGNGNDLVIDGGSLSVLGATQPWSFIGQSRSSSLTISSSGSFGAVNLAIGQDDSINGQECSFILDGGSVDISSTLFLGRNFNDSHTATAMAVINGGTLTANALTIDANNTCVMDVAGGTVYLAGDRTAAVAAWVG